MYQYDLVNPAVPPQLIYNSGGSISNSGRGLKKGPDGLVYWIFHNPTTNSTRHLGVINNPNQAGVACNFDPLGFDMGIDLGNTHKFPEMLVYTNNPPIVQDNTLSECLTTTNTIQITNLINEPDGDQFTVSLVSVLHGNASVLSNNNIEYTPPSPSNFDDEITYEVCDQACFSFCRTAKVIIPACNPLSVNFLNFFINNRNGIIELSWSTSHETNSNYFVIERSADGLNYIQIGIVRSKGTLDDKNSYQWFDSSPVSGTSYYRIVEYDKDGSTTTSNKVSIHLLQIHLLFFQIQLPE